MEMKNVWTIMDKKDLPSKTRILPMRWIFKIKNDMRHRARLVAKGFRQIKGVDYDLSHSPVLSEVAFRLLLLFSLQKGREIVTIDIEKAFLEPKVDEDIYIYTTRPR